MWSVRPVEAGRTDLLPVEEDPRPESIEVVEFRHPVLEEA
jgi:hypothetical protein